MLEKIFGGGKKSKAKKVLIVEDDALLSKVLSDGFLHDNFQVATVSSGLEVMDAVKKFSPDFILLDLIIPGMDGFAVLKQLKDDDKVKDIPVAIISNLSEAGDVKSTKALGAEEYFIKANTEISKIIGYVKSKLKV